MSKTLANKLMSAESPESFLRSRHGRAGWEMFAALKEQVDSLVHSDLNAAGDLVERIEQVARLIQNSQSRSFAQASHASLLHAMGNHAEANRLYEDSVLALRAGNLRKHAAMLEKQQVYVLTQMGRYDDALRVARSARRVLAGTDKVQLAQLETNIGTVYYRLDKYAKALVHYDRAKAILPRTSSHWIRAFIDGNRSNVFVETDQPEKALRLLETAIPTWEQAGKTLAAAQARSKIAYIHFLRGNYNAALASYYPAREQLEALGSGWLVAWCNLEIAEILLALNSFGEAIESAEKARARFAEMNMPYESAQAAVVLALSGMGLKQPESAHENLITARAVFEQNENTTFVALIDSYLGEMALQRGDHREAVRRAISALGVFNKEKLSARAANSRRIIAWAAYLAGDRRAALRNARLALRGVQRLSLPGVAYQCHHLIGKIERDRGRGPEALDGFRLAVRAVERMRGGIVADEFKATFLRDKIEVYEDAIAACLDEGGKGRVEEAFRLVEASKSRALADLLARYLRSAPQKKTSAGRKDPEAETRMRLLKLIEDLNWYSSQAGLEEDKGGQRKVGVAERYRNKVLRCERQIGQLFRRLEATGSAFAEVQRLQATNVKDLCQVLEPGETAVEYFTTGEHISAFIASRSGIRVERAISSKREVEHLLAGLRFQLEKFNYGPGFADEHFEQLNHATNQHLIQLYELTFAAVEKYVKGDHLILMPHGLLHYVPFHALLDRRGYLIDRFEISYAPSATVLKLCRQRAAQIRGRSHVSDQKTASDAEDRHGVERHGRLSKSSSADAKMLALGVEDRETPSIEQEVKEVCSMFSNALSLTGGEATHANLMKFAPRARFLHLASHGYFRRDNPMFSFLKLADSQLNFYNLLDLKLKAEMVTLSACHTGVNMVFPGDELHGLMRGFLYAGAPSVVASLWAANDASTAAFMSKMYSRILAGDTKRAAVRAAQLAVKDDYGHPYYWAPFLLMGNPN